LGKTYELEGEANVVALRNITLRGESREGAIKKGEFVIIRGPSGGGKTTFLNLLGTIDKSTNGTLCICSIIKGLKDKR
jgi:putative ABC transport system ATP-binding protein